MNICIFDTETTNLNKPFCYNIGFLIVDTETEEILAKEEFIVEQIWHNLALFSTAYYADKRPVYISRMKAKKIKMDKFGYITQRMARLFKDFNVQFAYAYNSNFDEKVFNFCCDWFKCINPFDNIQILDIRGLVHNKIAFTEEFQKFCDKYKRYTESGNYSTTAETVFQYINNQYDFEEEHTALADSIIEWEILKNCIDMGCEYGKEYKVYNSIPRVIQRYLTIIDNKNNTCTDFIYTKMRKRENGSKIILD